MQQYIDFEGTIRELDFWAREFDVAPGTLRQRVKDVGVEQAMDHYARKSDYHRRRAIELHWRTVSRILRDVLEREAGRSEVAARLIKRAPMPQVDQPTQTTKPRNPGRLLTDGHTTQSISAWARAFGVSKQALSKRINQMGERQALAYYSLPLQAAALEAMRKADLHLLQVTREAAYTGCTEAAEYLREARNAIPAPGED